MLNNPNIVFTTESAVRVGEKCFFVAFEMNVVCSIDMQTGKVEVIGSIPEEDIFSKRVCIKIVSWNEELIFVPMNGKKVWFYHIRKKTWTSLHIKNDNIRRKIRQAFIYKDKLFMVGCHYPAIICVDLNSKLIQYIESPFKELSSFYKEEQGYFREDYVLRGDLLYFASFLTNKVLIFNLQDFKWKYITVGKAENGYSGIAWDGNFFWLSPIDQPFIVKWDGSKRCWEYPLPYRELNKKLLFLGVLFWNGDVIFPAREANYTLILRHADIEKCELKEEQYLFFVISSSNEIICGDKKGNIVILAKREKKFCFKFNVPLDELLEKLKIKKEYKKFLQTKFSDIVFEDRSFRLEELLSYVNILHQTESEEFIIKKPPLNCGKNIMKRLS